MLNEISELLNIKRLPIRIYAGSVKSGGGKTVVAVMAGRLQKLRFSDIVVYVSDIKIANELSGIYPEISFRIFGSKIPSVLRTIWAKFYFFFASLFWDKNSVVLSVNFWLPVRCKLVTYHVNLLNFETKNTFNIAWMLRMLDARAACLLAELNMFESEYLLDCASRKIGRTPVNSVIQYLGYNSLFLNTSERDVQSGIIVLVSSIQPHKNNENLLPALENLVANHPEVSWKLLVFGGQSKAQWSAFVEEARKLGIADQVKVMGPHSQEVIAKYMSTASVVVSCSLVESFCMVGLEAMASGCPVIVTDRTSMPESVGSAGIIIPHNDTTKLAEAIHRVNSDQQYRAELINAGYQHILKFEENNLAKTLMKNLSLLDNTD